MTTATLPFKEKTRRKAYHFRFNTLPRYKRLAKARYQVYARDVKKNIYSVLCLSSFTIAGFIHSVFTGFIVMGVCWAALELKTRGM